MPMNNLNAPLKIQPEYVSVEDFKTYTGIDLYEELPEGKDALLFLRDAEDELINYANMQSWRPINRYIVQNKFSPVQMTSLRTAILMQAKYMFENGDAMGNSGLDPEEGVKFGKYERESAAISPKAINELKMSGIITLVMRSRW